VDNQEDKIAKNRKSGMSRRNFRKLYGRFSDVEDAC
jgi:hypothetical protein